MTIDDQFEPNDSLALATAALREAPIPDGPSAEVLTRAQRIAGRQIGMRLGVLASAASVAVIFSGVIAYLLLWKSGGVAFADVAQTIGQTRTFTATVDAVGGFGKARLLVKDSRYRFEYPDFIEVYDPHDGTMLQLISSTHVATLSHIKEMDFDLYKVISNYRPGNEKSIGEKTINGKTAEGFVLENQDEDQESWTFWIDPATKMPVQVEAGPTLMTDFHFDVPLADSLFDMSLPAGYALAQDAWDRFKYAGQVVDERGKSVEGVEVTATIQAVDGKSFGYIDVVNTGVDGRFKIDRDRGIGGSQSALVNGEPIRLEFKHPDLLYVALQDVNSLSPQARGGLYVRMRDGKKIDGRVVDLAGKPVSGVLVQAMAGAARNDLDEQYNYRKAAVTKGDGRFELRGLPGDKVHLQAIGKGGGLGILSGNADVDLSSAVKPQEITVRPFELPAGTVVHELFGMKLVDVNDPIRAALFLTSSARVLILDPGKASSRLNIGDLQRGDAFYMAGDTRIKNFKEFARGLLSGCEAEKRAGRSTYSVRVVYLCTRSDAWVGITAAMSLNEADRAELEKVVGK